jgi:hypothetical protein
MAFVWALADVDVAASSGGATIVTRPRAAQRRQRPPTRRSGSWAPRLAVTGAIRRRAWRPTRSVLASARRAASPSDAPATRRRRRRNEEQADRSRTFPPPGQVGQGNSGGDQHDHHQRRPPLIHVDDGRGHNQKPAWQRCECSCRPDALCGDVSCQPKQRHPARRAQRTLRPEPARMAREPVAARAQPGHRSTPAEESALGAEPPCHATTGRAGTPTATTPPGMS